MSKPKGYYIFECDKTKGLSAYPGVMKKIDQQINVLEDHFEMHKLFLERKNGVIAKRVLPGSRLFQWEKLLKDIRKPALIYIRKPILDKGIINFLKVIKRKHPKTKVILEIPTYPYAKEIFIHDYKNFPLFIRDVLAQNQLKKYVDRIVTFSDDNEIFGIRTIQIMNGIDVGGIVPRSPKTDPSEIHLLAIATFQTYHGYERVIRGLENYYSNGGTRNIILDMVGYGEESDNYASLTKQLGISDHVRFHGAKYGDELNEFYDLADIGLTTFGAYKLGISLLSSLKTREYIAYGLPLVGAGKQDIFEKNPSPYYLRFKNDPSVVDMKAILRFYDNCYYSGKNCDQVIREIRSYAEKYADMRSTFSPVTDYLLNALIQQRPEHSSLLRRNNI